MAKQRFKATLKPAGPGGAWTGIFLTETQSANFVSWITEAKRQDTKDKRLAETMRLLKAGTKWKDK